MFKWDDSVLRKASCLHCIVPLKTLIYAVVFNLFLFWVCVSLNYVTCGFPVAVKLRFFCSTVWNVQGNKFQTNFRFLSFSLSSPLSLLWFQVRDAAGDMELGDSGMNRSSKLKHNSHLGSSMACAICHCKVLLFRFFLDCGGFFFNFAFTLWLAWSAGHTLHRQHDFAVENLLRTSLLGILLLWQSWLWIDVLSALWFHRLWCL